MPIQVVTVNLSTDKPVMQRNGKATISVNIDGAENLDLEKNHFQVELTNHSPGIVSFRNSKTNSVNWDLNNSNTKNGSAVFTAQMKGTAAGTYTLSALLDWDYRSWLDRDQPIPMDDVESIKDLENYSIRRLMDTRRELERRIKDSSGDTKKWLEKKLKIVNGAIKQRGVDH